MTGAAGDTMPTGTMSDTPQVLLAHHLKQLKLPTVLSAYYAPPPSWWRTIPGSTGSGSKIASKMQGA